MIVQHFLKEIDALVEKRDFEKAKEKFLYLLQKYPGDFHLFYRFSHLLLMLGETADAIKVLEQGLKVEPDNLEGLNDLAVMYRKAGNDHVSEKLLKKVLALSPDYYYALNNLISLYRDNNLLEDALALSRKAVKIYGREIKPHINLGLTYRKLNEYQKALDSFNTGLELKPDSHELYFQLGDLFLEVKDYDKAEVLFKKAIDLCPHIADYYNNLGVTLYLQEKYKEAVAVNEKCLKLNADHSRTYINMSLALCGLRKFAEAIQAAEKAIMLNPNNADAYNNLGTIYEDSLKLEKAKEYFEKAVSIRPDHASANWNLAVVTLRLGYLREGFKMYEWRWRNEYAQPKPELDSMEWKGEDLKGKSILIYSEQGFGDAIHFARYLPMVKGLGAKIIFQCRKELLPLMKNLDCVDELVTDVEGVACEYNAALLTLPEIFKTDMDTIPNKVPYLFVKGEKVPFARDPERLNIGFVWSGNPSHKSHDERIINLKQFFPLFDIPGTKFFSLQVGEDSGRIKELNLENKVTDLSPQLSDFAKTASIITQLDLIVGSDTSVMHLCGALGVMGYVFIPRLNDWRWLQEREDSPWYPTLKLFRQKEYKNWKDVVLMVREEILRLKGNK
jgi:tetratricopeptide (TPR) repeat protein